MLLHLQALLPRIQNTRKFLLRPLSCYGNQPQSSIFVPQKMCPFSQSTTHGLAYLVVCRWTIPIPNFCHTNFWKFCFVYSFMNCFLGRFTFFTYFGPKIDEKIRKKSLKINEEKLPKSGATKVWYRPCPPAYQQRSKPVRCALSKQTQFFRYPNRGLLFVAIATLAFTQIFSCVLYLGEEGLQGQQHYMFPRPLVQDLDFQVFPRTPPLILPIPLQSLARAHTHRFLVLSFLPACV